MMLYAVYKGRGAHGLTQPVDVMSLNNPFPDICPVMDFRHGQLSVARNRPLPMRRGILLYSGISA